MPGDERERPWHVDGGPEGGKGGCGPLSKSPCWRKALQF